MANVLLTPTKIVRKTLFHFMQELVWANNVYREYVKEFTPGNGPTLTYRKPNKFRATAGRTIAINEVKERSDTITLNDQEHVAWAFNSDDLTLTIEEYNERYIRPAAIALANYVDYTGLGLYQYVYNQVGTPGTTPQDFLTFAQAKQRLTEETADENDRTCIVSAECSAYVTDALKGLMHQQIVGNIVEKGWIGRLAGFKFLESNNVRTHIVGTYDPAASGAKDGASSQGDTTMLMKSMGNAKTLTKGDIFTLAAVNAVNPVSGQAYARLQQFVAAALATSGVGGDMTVTVLPSPIYSSAATATTFLPYQNIDTLPANSAALTRAGTLSTTYPINLAFHRYAFAVVTVPLAMPDGVAFKAQENFEGLNIRILKDYDITNDREIIRCDIWAGFKCQYPEFACRIIG